MKQLLLPALVLGLYLTHLSPAQVYTPPPAQTPTPAKQGAASQQQPPASGQQQQGQSGDNPLLGNELPFVNPQDETVTLNGQTIPLGDNRILGARFEKYLNEPEDSSEEAKEYYATIDEILKLLNPKNTDPMTLSKTVGLLARAANYPGDAKISDTLAQVIFTSVLSRKGREAKRATIAAMEKESDQLANRLSRLGDADPIERNKQDIKIRVASAAFNRSDPKFVHLQARQAELAALRKRFEGEASISLLEAKVLYQAALVQLFYQRRFQHVIIGTRVYNRIFTDGDSKLRIEKGSAASKIFGENFGMPPTIATLDALANEAVRDVERHMKAIDYQVEQKELVGAGKRLSEAFLLGEFMPPIATFPREKKRQIHKVLRSGYKLYSAMAAKDYEEADNLVKEISAEASDFDASKARSIIAGYTRASDLHLFKAKQALVKQDQETMDEEVKQAMEIWPRNPKLNDLEKVMVATSDVVVAKQDFERHLAERNYRQIFREQYRFAPVVQGDEKLEDAFKQIITNITRIETAIAKADEFTKMGQENAAWEELKTMRDLPTFSQDPELGKKIEDLMPKVSDLTSALDKARRLEDMNETGSALAWYLQARSIYPNSKFAKEGIDRLLAKVLQ